MESGLLLRAQPEALDDAPEKPQADMRRTVAAGPIAPDAEPAQPPEPLEAEAEEARETIAEAELADDPILADEAEQIDDIDGAEDTAEAVYADLVHANAIDAQDIVVDLEGATFEGSAEDDAVEAAITPERAVEAAAPEINATSDADDSTDLIDAVSVEARPEAADPVVEDTSAAMTQADGADTLAAIAAALAAPEAADTPTVELAIFDTSDLAEGEMSQRDMAEAAHFATSEGDEITLDQEALFGTVAALDGASVAERLARIRRASSLEDEEDGQEADEMTAAFTAEIPPPSPMAQPLMERVAFDDTVADDAAYEDGFEEDNAPTDDDAAITAAIAAATAREPAPQSRPVQQPARIDAPTPMANAVTTAPAQPAAEDDAPQNDDTRSFGDVDGTDRLFEATESRMSNADTTRRRANIEHLKAAVAARSAERQLDPEGAEDAADDTADYREDLAQVMRPRRVRVDVTLRTEAPRPAPLVLVSEQRVDDIRPASDDPVRPRRVQASAAGTEAAPSLRLAEAVEPSQEAPRKLANSLAQLAQRAGVIMNLRRGGATVATAEAIRPAVEQEAARLEDDVALHGERFAELLDQSDAVEIDEVIELAAEYAETAFGTGTFDRTRLFRMIAEATDGSISHEDMLNAFGGLIRHGRIERVARGAFRLVPLPEID